MKKFSIKKSVMSALLLTATVSLQAKPVPATHAVDSLSPLYDLQLRINNTTQSGSGFQLEIRHGVSLGDNGFVGALQFNLNDFVSKLATIDSVVLQLTTQQKGGDVDIRPFATNWDETGGTTYSFASLQTEINAAVAATNIKTFTPNWPAKKIFEWDCTTPVNITNWQTKINITDYVKTFLQAGGSATMGLLLIPNVPTFSSTGSQFFTKDVTQSNYGVSTTAGFTSECVSTGTTVSRWSRIMDLLAKTGANQGELYPKLKIYTTTGLGTGVNHTDNQLFVRASGTQALLRGTEAGQVIRVYNAGGQLVKQLTATGSEESIRLSAGMYLLKVENQVLKVVI
jgi:hypothetical protein